MRAATVLVCALGLGAVGLVVYVGHALEESPARDQALAEADLRGLAASSADRLRAAALAGLTDNEIERALNGGSTIPWAVAREADRAVVVARLGTGVGGLFGPSGELTRCFRFVIRSGQTADATRTTFVELPACPREFTDGRGRITLPSMPA